jgi:hypothetical protein
MQAIQAGNELAHATAVQLQQIPMGVHLPGEAKASKELCSCPANAPIRPILAITQLPDLGLKVT